MAVGGLLYSHKRLEEHSLAYMTPLCLALHRNTALFIMGSSPELPNFGVHGARTATAERGMYTCAGVMKLRASAYHNVGHPWMPLQPFL